jgi:hypothetical protein
MWISKKTAGQSGDKTGVSIGRVTVGGEKPCVLTEGETRCAELAACPGVYVPAAGDEVILCRTCDGENVVLGKISEAADAQSGEVYITTEGGGSVTLRNNGDIELSGTIRLVGTVYVTGSLIINGQAYSQEG